VLTYDETPEERETPPWKGEGGVLRALHAHIIRRTDTNNVEWIGVDPGRRKYNYCSHARWWRQMAVTHDIQALSQQYQS
jgi:hypothetical protein